jgi:hypothetical protein
LSSGRVSWFFRSCSLMHSVGSTAGSESIQGLFSM